MLGPVDPRDTIYSKTRLRTTSTDQSSRRQPHCKKCTLAASYFIGRHPNTGRTFTRAPVSSRTIERRLAEGDLGSGHSLRVLPFTPFVNTSFCSGAYEKTVLQRNRTKSSLAMNPD
ncbi:uncharacterized protein TNCV_1038401 [Trichonephila clavipes]|uniref:Uncharacterized protein n=1 Tax=Trichonephila clavipes TaxID=2585209 RepID=A0A8X6VW74_TRICX|nr:uncharacterized protein TNCV_1038401 [Trichonephila clavipes]